MGTCFCQTGGYKEHFVCFACRKMFKKPAHSDRSEFSRAGSYEEYHPVCPECGLPMHNMGKEFAPPRQNDKKAWREVERNHSEIQKRSMTLPSAGKQNHRHA